jgi:PAS domain S-box-containing protein
MAASSSPAPAAGDSHFQGKLARNFIILMLLMSLLPLLVVGAAAYHRSRQLVRNQAAAQLEVIIGTQASELERIAAYNTTLIDRMKTDDGLKSAIATLLADPEKLHKRTLVNWQLNRYCRISDTENGFHTLALYLPDQTLITATDDTWLSSNDSNNSVVQTIFKSGQSIAIYNPEPFYANQLVIFSSFTLPVANSDTDAIIIGSIVSDIPSQGLLRSRSFFQNARAFYKTQENIFLGMDEGGEHFSYLSMNPELEERILHHIKLNPEGVLDEYRSQTGETVLSYTRWIPDLQIGIVLEVPLNIIYQQLNFLTPLNTIIFFAAMLLSAAIAYFASTQIVRPVITLVEHARHFSKGDWSQRAKINRKDEIGLLAHTFNTMVEQLSDLYQSLELKVNERSRQIRLASEIGHIATSTQNQNEVLQRTAALLIERFDYSYAAIYIVEESGLYAVLQEESEIKPGLQSYVGSRLRIGSDSLVGWVASNNQARIVANPEDELFPQQIRQPGTSSEVAIPIAAGELVYGILNVQSDTRNKFDSDAVAVLQTLANHISSGLTNIRLLETVQIDLQETTLLYRASRQISQAKNEREVIQLVVNALKETPFISGFYAIHPDHISVIMIFDSRDEGTHTRSEGITLPLKNIPKLFSETRLILIDDISSTTELDHILSYYNRRGCRSAAVIPLYEDGILAKMVILGARESQDLSDSTLQPYANLLAVAGTTLGRLRILATLQKRIDELQLLTRISEEISAYSVPGTLYRSLQKQIEIAVEGECEFIITLYNRATDQIEVPYAWAEGNVQVIAPFPACEGLTSHIIRTQKPLLINGDARSTAHDLGIRLVGKPAKSWLGIPLVVAGSVIGVLIVQDTDHEDRFTIEHLKLFTMLAPQIATAFRNIQLILELDKVREAYEQESLLLATLLENCPDQIYFKDKSGRYLRASHSYSNQFNGAKPEELIGQNDITFLGYQSGAPIFKTEQELMSTNTKEIGSIENTIDENGDEIWRISSRIPVMNNQQCVGLLAISRDITSMKLAEEREKRNAHQLLTAAEIAHDTSGTLDLRELMRKAVNMVRERFGFYHASIFLLDATGAYAVLEESTGTAGQQMKGSHHRLSVGSQSIVGQVTQAGEPLVINDVRGSSIYYHNPLLPDTRAEIAIPLKIGDRILGALDVQSVKHGAFSEQDIAILQILADQLSVAVFNANLFVRAQENIDRHRLLHEITTAASLAVTTEEILHTTVQSLHAIMTDDRVSVFILNGGRLELRASAGHETTAPAFNQFIIGEGSAGKAVQERQPVLARIRESKPIDGVFYTQYAVPIIYSRNVVGALMVESPKADAYDNYDQEIISTLGSSLGPILYNNHLMAEVRQQVERERLIYEATSRIHRSIDIQTILKTSAAEISKAVGARSVKIEILHGPANDNGEPGSSKWTEEKV